MTASCLTLEPFWTQFTGGAFFGTGRISDKCDLKRCNRVVRGPAENSGLRSVRCNLRHFTHPQSRVFDLLGLVGLFRI
jgi:formylglycine-generating enzyme required for sulfatase activity